MYENVEILIMGTKCDGVWQKIRFCISFVWGTFEGWVIFDRDFLRLRLSVFQNIEIEFLRYDDTFWLSWLTFQFKDQGPHFQDIGGACLLSWWRFLRSGLFRYYTGSIFDDLVGIFKRPRCIFQYISITLWDTGGNFRCW